MKLCKIRDCSGLHEARGFCNKHYLRWRTHGDPHVYKVGRPRNCSLAEVVAFEVNRAVLTDGGCLETQAALNEKGYGQVTFNGGRRTLHRLVLQNAIDRNFQKNEIVRHVCHNPMCVNVKHLRLGNHRDNMNDMVRANRQAKGYNSHLTPYDVFLIRIFALFALQRRIAKAFGVTQETISRIVRYKTWKHVA